MFLLFLIEIDDSLFFNVCGKLILYNFVILCNQLELKSLLITSTMTTCTFAVFSQHSVLALDQLEHGIDMCTILFISCTMRTNICLYMYLADKLRH